MRHLTARVIIASLTFIIGVTATTVWFINHPSIVDESITSSAPSSDPAGICDIIRNPDNYSSKIVRVQAIIIGYHELALYDPSCNSEEKYLPVNFDAASRQKLISAIDTLNDAGFQRGSFWASVVLVGRIEAIEDGDRKSKIGELEKANRQYIKYRFRLIVLNVEHVEAASPDVPWPQ